MCMSVMDWNGDPTYRLEMEREGIKRLEYEQAEAAAYESMIEDETTANRNGNPNDVLLAETRHRQATADAHHLAADNATLSRTVTRMSGALKDIRNLLDMLASQIAPITVEWTSSDGYYERLGGDVRKMAQSELEKIAQVLDRENQAIEMAASVWPPVEDKPEDAECQ